MIHMGERRRLAMPNAIALRPDFMASELRGLLRRDLRWRHPQRGGTPGNVTLQIVRDWVVRFNAEEPDGLRDRKSAPRRG
jgi:hypothetical protein